MGRIAACSVFYLILVLAHLPSAGESWDNSITNEWVVHIGAMSDSTPAIAPDGTIYFGTFDGRFWAISAAGRRKWSFSSRREIHSSPAIDNEGNVYFGSRDRSFYALSSQGTKKWEFQTGAWNDSSPAIGNDGTIYFGSWDKQFYAINPDGSKKWQFSTGGEIVSSPAVDREGRIAFGSHDHKFYILEANGTKACEFTTGGAILSSPAIDADGNFYFTSVDGNFYAVKPDGSLRWRLHTGGISESSPIIGPGGVIYVGVDKEVWAISLTGEKKSEQEVTSDQYQMPIEGSQLALADGSLCVISGYGLLVNRNHLGPYRWSFHAPGYGSASPVVGATGTVYIAGMVKEFYALRASVRLARTPWPKFRGDPRNTGNARNVDLSPGQERATVKIGDP
jgi:outer membrane protein assembly factor BamB